MSQAKQKPPLTDRERFLLFDLLNKRIRKINAKRMSPGLYDEKQHRELELRDLKAKLEEQL